VHVDVIGAVVGGDDHVVARGGLERPMRDATAPRRHHRGADGGEHVVALVAVSRAGRAEARDRVAEGVSAADGEHVARDRDPAGVDARGVVDAVGR
jgi:hypothetical protein